MKQNFEQSRLAKEKEFYSDTTKSFTTKKYDLLNAAIQVFKAMLKLTGLYKIGVKNAQDIKLNHYSHNFENLPTNFKDFKIMHLSDLHLDESPIPIDRIIELVEEQKVDLCVHTGDYLSSSHSIHTQRENLRRIINAINCKFGHLGILGNHDSINLKNELESLGIELLMNQSKTISVEDEFIDIIGADDVHYFYDIETEKYMETKREHFSLALAHSAELYQNAEKGNVDFYLCGHTHGGQIALPFGIPIFTHLKKGKRFYRGSWKYKGLIGFTSCGVGTVGIPVRFNTRGEIAIHQLKKL